MYRQFWLSVLFGLVALSSAGRAELSPRQTHSLQNGWLFQLGRPDDLPIAKDYNDAGWQQVAVPHSWNRLGEYSTVRSQQTNAYQGIGWYRLRVPTPASKAGDRHILQFDGVGTVADIWFNGHHLGQHRGGYSAFRFDVTKFVSAHADNLLVVRADNNKPMPGNSTDNILPLSGDFFPYGGLYRGVKWIVAPPQQIDLFDHAGPGVYISTLSAGDDRAEIQVLTRLRSFAKRPAQVELVTTIRDGREDKARSVSARQKLSANGTAEVAQRLIIPQPRLWQGRQDPHLYTVTVELRSGKKVLDRVDQPLGIRTFRIDPNLGFFLNGKPLALRGVSRHQDMASKGAALSDADHERDMDLIEEVGANTIRFAHYQHAKKWFELADQRGMIVWAEIPYVSMATFGDGLPSAAFVENARQQLIELIRQNYNHPSVVVWGVGNEIDSKSLGGKPVKAQALVRDLHSLAKAEDPSRLSALADCCASSPFVNPATAEQLIGLTDVVGLNRYPGWYSPDPSAMGAILDRMHAQYPNVPLSVTEYGAGGALSQHSDNPTGGAINAFGRPHPEGYQSWVHEENWRQLKSRRYLWASWVWNMFDFASDFRAEGDAIDLNDKGLVTFDRTVRKDAFYFYKANWSSAPLLHLTGRRYVDRAYPVADISAYTNASAARLSVNGVELGEQPCPDRICVWRNVALAPGQNKLLAKAHVNGAEVEDAIALNGPDADRQGIRINAGDLTSMALADGRRFGSDHFFSGGDSKALNPRTITALFERRGAKPKSVAKAQSAVLHDGYREGRFTYDIPIPNGNWVVRITTFEPDSRTPGQRSFSVAANGKTALASVDPAAVAGAALTEVVLSFPVNVTAGRLTLAFNPIKGPAIVSALEIERP